GDHAATVLEELLPWMESLLQQGVEHLVPNELAVVPHQLTENDAVVRSEPDAGHRHVLALERLDPGHDVPANGTQGRGPSRAGLDHAPPRLVDGRWGEGYRTWRDRRRGG